MYNGRQITLKVFMEGVYHPKVSGLYPGREPLRYLNRDKMCLYLHYADFTVAAGWLLD